MNTTTLFYAWLAQLVCTLSIVWLFFGNSTEIPKSESHDHDRIIIVAENEVCVDKELKPLKRISTGPVDCCDRSIYNSASYLINKIPTDEELNHGRRYSYYRCEISPVVFK